MDEDEYEGDSSPARMWGCFSAALIGVPVFVFLFLADALGDCVPDLPCEKGFFSEVLLPSGGIALAVGLLVWWAVKSGRMHDR